MLDDTCYFLPCQTAVEAAVLAALCNDPITLGLINSISFRDAKRPITKQLLQRLDFTAVLERRQSHEVTHAQREPCCATSSQCAARPWSLMPWIICNSSSSKRFFNSG